MSRPFAEVIGDPVAHSKSPLIHRFWLSKLGLAGDYSAFRVPVGEVADYLALMCADGDWRGCNVTIPHKVSVMDFVDDPGGFRASIGAMNTVLRRADGGLDGTNTDAAGFAAALDGLGLAGAPAVVVGTGGAARAILFALAGLEIGRVTIVARSTDKATELLDQFGLAGEVRSLAESIPAAALLVNASSLGMTGQPPLAMDISPLPAEAIVYDIVYSPLETPLLAAARARGLRTIDGLQMLVGQAAAAFELFFGQPAPRQHDAELRALLTA